MLDLWNIIIENQYKGDLTSYYYNIIYGWIAHPFKV